MASEDISTIKPGGGGDYSSLEAWEAAEQTDLVSADTIAVAECYDGGNCLADASNFTINGWTTDATRYICIRAASAYAHSSTGTLDTSSAYMQSSGSRTAIITTVHDLLVDQMQLKMNGATAARYGVYCLVGCENFEMRNCFLNFVSNTAASNYYGCLYFNNNTASGVDKNVTVTGNIWLIEHQASTTSIFYGCYLDFPASTTDNYNVNFYNNTIINPPQSASVGNRPCIYVRDGEAVVRTDNNFFYGTRSYGPLAGAVLWGIGANDFQAQAAVGQPYDVSSPAHQNTGYSTSVFTNVTIGTEDFTPAVGSPLLRAARNREAQVASLATALNGVDRDDLYWDVGAVQSSTAPATPSFTYYKALTIDSSLIGSDLTDFPAALVLASDPDLVASARSDGYDIMFYSDTDLTERLAHDLISYDSGTGALEAYVRCSPTSASDLTIYMAYGSGDITTDQSTNQTYSAYTENCGDAFWLHMDDDPDSGSANETDSTSAEFDLNAESAVGTNADLDTSGVVGSCIKWANGSATNAGLRSLNGAWAPATGFTQSFWVKSNGAAHSYVDNYAFWTANSAHGRNWGWSFDYTSATTGSYQFMWSGFNGGTPTYTGIGYDPSTDSAWKMLTAVFTVTGQSSGTMVGDLDLYVDGSLHSTVSPSYINGTQANTSYYTAIGYGISSAGPGRYYFDEVRRGSFTASADWVAAEYENQSAPTPGSGFWSIGGETPTALFPLYFTGTGSFEICGGVVHSDYLSGADETGAGSVILWANQPYWGVSFEGKGGYLSGLQVFLAKATNGPVATSMGAYLFAHTGTFGTSSLPTGAVLSTSTSVDIDLSDTDRYTFTPVSGGVFTWVPVTFCFPRDQFLAYGTHYCIVFGPYNGSIGSYLLPKCGPTATHDGNSFYCTLNAQPPTASGWVTDTHDIAHTVFADNIVIPYTPSVTIKETSRAKTSGYLEGEAVALENIWNSALTSLGAPTVSSTSDGSAEATLIDGIWEEFFEPFVTDHGWNSLKTTATLSKLTDSVGTEITPPTRWSNVFALPTDYLQAICLNGLANQPQTEVLFEIESINVDAVKTKALMTNQATAELEYLFDPGAQVTLMHPATRRACAACLAAFIAPRFGKSEAEIEGYRRRAELALVDATAIDSQENTPRFFAESPLLNSRRRWGGRWAR